MRRFLSISFIIFALVVSAAGATPAAHALGCSPPTPFSDAGGDCFATQAEANTADNANNADQTAKITDTGSTVTPAQYDANYTAQNGTNAAASTKATAGGTADASKPTSATPTAGESFGTIMTWIMSLFAWLVGVAAVTLDYAVYYTVVTMGDYVKHLTAVGVTWRILRDIGNIMLIFGFLAVGITTILNVDWYGGGKKMLPMMFVAAIFLNFSLFFAEAIIDTGNLFATQFYTQIKGGSLPTSSYMSDTTFMQQIEKEGISNKLMNQLGLQTLYGSARDPDGAKTILKAGNSWIIGFMGIILFIITAFVMFSLAFILIARFVILIFLIILAPIGFAGLAVPMLKQRADQWWSKLFEQTITAPVLLLMLYIALAVITDASFLTGFGTSKDPGKWLGFLEATGFNNLPGFAAMILSFLVAMGLLILVVIQAKNLSAFGAAGATKLAGKLTFGLTAAGMRSTVGWGSQGASQALRRTKFGQSKYGRVLTTTLDKGAKASFDIRGATIGGGLKGIGVEAGEAQKGGYRKRREDAIKGHQEYVKSVVESINERGATGKEEKTIANAEIAQTNAAEAHKKAKQKLEPQITQQRAEVDRLKLQKEQEESISPNMTADPETERKLAAAEAQLATSEGSLKTSSDKLAEAATDLANAKNAPDDRIKEERTKAQLDYAKSIKGSFPGWAMYGPGGTVAANKIIKEAGKTNEQRQVDALMDLLKKSSTSTPASTPSPAGGAPKP